MRGKAKMLLLPFNLVWLALILASFFDKNVAYNEPRLMATIQQNLIYATFPGERFPQTRYTFNAGRVYFSKAMWGWDGLRKKVTVWILSLKILFKSQIY
ncbi:unnamed protein product [Meloidogyne enterolobii]|uniref:Uncharacterized protein n=1 Tax=Meloidogyne enterolobii TaxID=390850 RepID=A0ACB1AHN9_MELEN